jgi:hypothetical protein
MSVCVASPSFFFGPVLTRPADLGLLWVLFLADVLGFVTDLVTVGGVFSWSVASFLRSSAPSRLPSP